MPIIDLHVVQYPELTEAMGDKVGIQSNNNPNFPTNKIHILIYDWCDKEILECMHNSIYFSLQIIIIKN
jgi:hypothetical protein